jgi:hypothetical protein
MQPSTYLVSPYQSDLPYWKSCKMEKGDVRWVGGSSYDVEGHQCSTKTPRHLPLAVSQASRARSSSHAMHWLEIWGLSHASCCRINHVHLQRHAGKLRLRFWRRPCRRAECGVPGSPYAGIVSYNLYWKAKGCTCWRVQESILAPH